MLLDVAVEDVRSEAFAVRRDQRSLIQKEGTTVAEMARLLAPRYRVGRRLLGAPGTDVPLALLRLQRPRHRNWHWAVWRDGLVYNPLADCPRPITPDEAARASYYEVEPQ